MAASLNLVPSQHLTLTPQMRQTLQVLQLSPWNCHRRSAMPLRTILFSRFANPPRKLLKTTPLKATRNFIGMPKEMTRKNGKLRQKKHFPAPP